MSLDIKIKYKELGEHNYFLEHPYSYDRLSPQDLANYWMDDEWSANITSNLGWMASHVPIHFKDNETGDEYDTTLYHVLWGIEELGEEFANTDWLVGALLAGINYMMIHRKELLQYEAENGWGTYNSFMKFLLNLLQACQDNPGCKIEVPR